MNMNISVFSWKKQHVCTIYLISCFQYSYLFIYFNNYIFKYVYIFKNVYNYIAIYLLIYPPEFYIFIQKIVINKDA